MLENVDLSVKVSKAEYKSLADEMVLKLGALQRRAHELNIPVSIVFEGWNAAGKGTLINNLIQPLDPRGFTVHSMLPPNKQERMFPFLQRFWCCTPAAGCLAIFDRSWYRRVLEDRVDGVVKGAALKQAYRDICSFERQLADDGNVIIKFFLHIAKKEQKRRFNKLRKDRLTAWRVTKDDLERHKEYTNYLLATEDMLAETDSGFAPWTVIEAHDRRFAALKIFTTVATALEQRIDAVERAAKRTAKKTATRSRRTPKALQTSVIDRLDLSLSLERKEYRERLKAAQKELRELEHAIYMERIPVVLVYEGCDAAGKGGNIRRLTEDLDPRGYEVVPIAAPNDIERAHHYLWRFWTQMPKAGHITIFDRSWYGRLLVERVEGFCSGEDWKRAYREINEMERHLANFGAVVTKFWLQIDRTEQLKRFKLREQTPHKTWKITEEDWRNRKKWTAYQVAVEEMLYRTSTNGAPWVIVESNCKWHARVKVLETVVKRIRKAL